MTPTELREQIAHIIEEQRASEPLEVADRILGLLQEVEHLDTADYDPQERAQTIAAVQQALASTASRPWSDIAREDREKYGIPE